MIISNCFHVRLISLFQAACPSGKISKSDTVIFLRSLNSGKEERIQAQATEIYQAFDVNGDGVVGKLQDQTK